MLTQYKKEGGISLIYSNTFHEFDPSYRNICFRSQVASVKACLVADEQGLCLGGKYMNEIAKFFKFIFTT
jgi:hypothetical protein